MNLEEFLNIWNELKKEYDANNDYKLPEADKYLAALSHNINNEKDEASIILMPSYTLSHLAEDENVLKGVNKVLDEWFNTVNLSGNGYQSFDDMETGLIDVCKEWEKETIRINGKRFLSNKQTEAQYEMYMMDETKNEKTIQKEIERQEKEEKLRKEYEKRRKAEQEERKRKEKEKYEQEKRESEERKRKILEDIEKLKSEQKERERQESDEREKIEREEANRERERKEKEKQDKINKENEKKEQRERDIDRYLDDFNNESKQKNDDILKAHYAENSPLEFLYDIRKDDAKPNVDYDLEEAENLKVEKKLVKNVSKEELGKKVTSIRDRIWEEVKKGDMGPVQKTILKSFTEASRTYPKACNTSDPAVNYFYWMENLLSDTKTGSLSLDTEAYEYDLKLNQVCDFMNEILDDGSFKDMTNLRKRYVEFAKKRFELVGGLDIEKPDIKKDNIEKPNIEKPNIEKPNIEAAEAEKKEENNVEFRERLNAEAFIEVEEPSALDEALEDFAAIQDRKLGWGMKGNNADKFDDIKASVADYNDPNNNKTDFEKRKSLYETCENYLRAHSSNGKKIGGQNTKVGRLRKQAVVEILQALEQYPDAADMKKTLEAEVQHKKKEDSKKPKDRVKLSFKDLERSLAKESDAKTGKIDKHDQKSIARKAYAELKTARMEKDKQKEAPKLGKNR